MGKVKEHLNEYTHVRNGVTARLKVTPWDRATVADGYWQTVNTIQPLINRDVYLAECLDDISAASHKYEPGYGIYFENLGNNYYKINADFNMSLTGSNGISVSRVENEGGTYYDVGLSGGEVNANFKFNSVTANNLSSTNLTSTNAQLANLTSTNITSTNISSTNITSTNISATNVSSNKLSAANVSSQTYSGNNITASYYSAKNTYQNYLSAANLSANSFTAYNGVFNYLTVNNTLNTNNLTTVYATATNLTSNSITSNYLTANTYISAANLTATNVTATNVSSSKLSATNITATYLSSTKVNVTGTSRRSFSVNADFDVYVKDRNLTAPKSSLSAVLNSIARTMTVTGFGYANIGMGTNYNYNQLSFTTYLSDDTSYNTYIDGVDAGSQTYPSNSFYSAISPRYPLNFEISDLISKDVTNYIVRLGMTSAISNQGGIYCISTYDIDATKIKPHKKYKFNVVNLAAMHPQGEGFGIKFYDPNYDSTHPTTWYLYDFPKMPCNWVQIKAYSQNNTRTSAASTFKQAAYSAIGSMTGKSITIPIIANTLYSKIYSHCRTWTDVASTATWYKPGGVVETSTYDGMAIPTEIREQVVKAGLGIASVTLTGKSGSIYTSMTYKPENVFEYLGNGQLEIFGEFDQTKHIGYIYCLNDYTDNGRDD